MLAQSSAALTAQLINQVLRVRSTYGLYGTAQKRARGAGPDYLACTRAGPPLASSHLIGKRSRLFEASRCNAVITKYLAKVVNGEEPVRFWNIEDQDTFLLSLREVTPERYELRTGSPLSVRIRVFDKEGNAIFEELKDESGQPTFPQVGLTDGLDHTTLLSDGSRLELDLKARPVLLIRRDPAGQLQWAQPDPLATLQTADSGPSNTTLVGGTGPSAENDRTWPPLIKKLDASGTVVWQKNLGTLPKYFAP